jgi:hypothetical protein
LECPNCSVPLRSGLARTEWLIIHDGQIFTAMQQLGEARQRGEIANLYGGTAFPIAHRLHPKGEKQFRCSYCSTCQFVAFSRADLIPTDQQVDFS